MTIRIVRERMIRLQTICVEYYNYENCNYENIQLSTFDTDERRVSRENFD